MIHEVKRLIFEVKRVIFEAGGQLFFWRVWGVRTPKRAARPAQRSAMLCLLRHRHRSTREVRWHSRLEAVASRAWAARASVWTEVGRVDRGSARANRQAGRWLLQPASGDG